MAEFTWQVGGCWRGRHGNPPLAATVGLSLLLVHPLNIHVYYELSTIYCLVQLSTVQSSSKSLVSSVSSVSCAVNKVICQNAIHCQQRSRKMKKMKLSVISVRDAFLHLYCSFFCSKWGWRSNPCSKALLHICKCL